jgi:beta-lactam-binding protein with PASTA domain
MKRILLIVAVLLMASPALAAVTVTATDIGGGVAQISYVCNGDPVEKVRAFAFDINLSGGAVISDICDYNSGDDANRGYGIFPGRFRDIINITNPNWVDPCYNPVAPTGDPDARGGIGTSGITVELGTLYTGPNAPPSSGTLFKIVCTGSGNTTLTMTANATRGGVVLEDGSTIAATLTGCVVATAAGCTVPDVVGMTQANADLAITAATLVVGTTTGAYDCTVPAGDVISQLPLPSTVVECSSNVTYVYSTGLPLVPNIVGMTRADANSAITARGLVVGTTAGEYSCAAAAGHVSSQNPAAETAVACGSTVTYNHSLGQVAVPNVKGSTRDDANSAITAVGLTVGAITTECNDTYPLGQVCSQTPVSGGLAACGSAVAYVVSTGGCCTTILNEVGVAKATAELAWTAQGFTLGTATGVNCVSIGLIISQDTGCKTMPYAVNYSYGRQATVPNLVGMTRNNAMLAITAAGFTYDKTYDANVPGTGQALRQVIASRPAAGTQPGCGSRVDINVVSYPIKPMTATASLYVNWQNRGRPQCWAYPRQGHGDADGKKQLANWVSGNDLAILRSAIGKADSLIPPTPTDPNKGICADFDHKKQLANWVSGNDLTLFRLYIGKAESLIPLCGDTSVTTDPNYWYWCLPTGGTCPTLPAGQKCAPAGICPNTP